MKYSIIIKTARFRHGLDLLFDCIANEVKGKEQDYEVILVDYCLLFDEVKEKREKEFFDKVNHRFKFIHVPCKPSIWQGPNRLTKNVYFDGPAAINTGFIVAEGEYIILLDDTSWISPGYFTHIEHAYNNNRQFIANYHTFNKFKAENGVLTEGYYIISGYTECDPDIDIEQPEFLKKRKQDFYNPQICPYKHGSGGFFGGCSGVFLKYILQINGSDEYFARYGCEDMDLGGRLSNVNDNFWVYPQAIYVEYHTENNENCEEGWPQRTLCIEDKYSEKNKLYTEKFHEPIFKANGGSYHPFQEKRIKHIDVEYSKFDLKEARKLFRETGKFPTPNYNVEIDPVTGKYFKDL